MFFDAAGLVMRAGWQAITSINFPGTGLPIASIFIGAFLVVLSLRLVGVMIGHIHFGSAVNGLQRGVKRHEPKSNKRGS